MARIEIDETELVNYRNIASAVQKMLANPETRSMILKAQKTVNPQAVIPELDAAKPALDAVGRLNERFEALQKEREEEKAEAKKEKALADLRAQWETGRAKARRAGYTVDGIEQLEKFMEEKGIADHEIAMPAFERANPPSTAIDASGSNRFDFFQAAKANEGSDMKLLIDGNEQQFMDKRIKEALAAVRSGNQ